MDADPRAQEAPHVLAVGRVEAEAADGLANPLPFVTVRNPRAGQRLRQIRGFALREAHDVDRCESVGEKALDGLVQRRLGVLEVERNGPILGMHPGHDPARATLDILDDATHVTQRRGEQQEGRVRQDEQRRLPCNPAVPVRVVMELVHDDVRDRSLAPPTQCHVR
jgi:hypothetical protein